MVNLNLNSKTSRIVGLIAIINISNDFRFSIAVNEMYGCCGFMEKVPTFECCATARSVHDQKIW